MSLKKSVREWLFTFFCGVLMGAADLVPGISGGTIAFICGIYAPLLQGINSINKNNLFLLLKGRFSEFKKEFPCHFFSALLLGILTAFFLFASIIHSILNHEIHRIYLYAAFMGLIAASTLLCSRHILIWQSKHFLALGLGAGIAFMLTSIELEIQRDSLLDIHLGLTFEVPLKNYDAERGVIFNVPVKEAAAMLSKGLILPNAWAYHQASQKEGRIGEFVKTEQRTFIRGSIIISGGIAICAMLLPGISGSYLLSILGVYPLVIGSLADFCMGLRCFQFNEQSFMVLANLGLGIIIGGILFSRIASRLLAKHKELSIATLIGFMIGAMKAVWPFCTYYYHISPLNIAKGPLLATDQHVLPALTHECQIAIVMFFLGLSSVLLLEIASSRAKQRPLTLVE